MAVRTHGRGGGLPSPSASPPCTPPSLCSSQEPEDTIRDSSPSPLPVGPPPQSLADAPCCGHRITVGNFSLQDSSKRRRAPPPRHGACTGQGNRVTGCTLPGHHTSPMHPSGQCQEEQAAAHPDAAMMPGKDPSPRGSCWCQAWAAAMPGMGTNCICLGKAPNKQQHQGGVQGVWVVPPPSRLSPTALSGTLGGAEGWRAEGASEPQGGDITAGSMVPHPHFN